MFLICISCLFKQACMFNVGETLCIRFLKRQGDVFVTAGLFLMALTEGPRTVQVPRRTQGLRAFQKSVQEGPRKVNANIHENMNHFKE